MLFQKLGDQLMFIQQAVQKYQINESDGNALEVVQTLLNGFVEIVVVEGTVRELVGSGLSTTQVHAVSSAAPVPDEKRTKPKTASKEPKVEIKIHKRHCSSLLTKM